MPEVGQSCSTPVNNENNCEVSTRYFTTETNVAIFSTMNGTGYDLPRGCIYDAVTKEKTGKTFVYWNPNGLVLSTDPNIRQICESRPDTTEQAVDQMIVAID